MASDVPYRLQEFCRPLHQRIDAKFELASMDQAVSHKNVLGVSRLYSLPAFDPEAVITCTFYSDSIRFDVMRSTTSLQWADEMSIERSKVRRRTFRFPYSSQTKHLFSSWSRFYDHAVQGSFCVSEMLDGIVYRHLVHDGDECFDYMWANPNPSDHRIQTLLLASYTHCVGAGRIRSYLPNWRSWQNRVAPWSF